MRGQARALPTYAEQFRCDEGTVAEEAKGRVIARSKIKTIKFYFVFLYSIFYKVQVQVGSVCIGVLVETSPKEKCPEFFCSPPPIPPENSH